MPSVVEDTFNAIVDNIGVNDGMNMSVSLSDSNETLLALTIFCSWEAFYSTIFTVYRIDTDGPSFCLVMPPKKRTHERYEGSPVVAGKLWAFAWWQGTRKLLAVGNIFNSQRQEMVMDIGASKFQASRYMVGPDINLTMTFRAQYRFYQRSKFFSRAAQACSSSVFRRPLNPPTSFAFVQYGVMALNPWTFICIPMLVHRKEKGQTSPY